LRILRRLALIGTSVDSSNLTKHIAVKKLSSVYRSQSTFALKTIHVEAVLENEVLEETVALHLRHALVRLQ
jgi:hypothetical protein